MSISLYQSVMPLWNQLLPTLDAILVKAEAHCAEAGIAPSELLEARLAPDMWDFTAQVHSTVVHSAEALHGALTGDFVPSYGNPPSGFAELRAGVAAAAKAVSAVDAATLDGRIGKDVTLHFGEHRIPFLAEDFLITFSLPNFAFHATTAYNILRMKGVPVGKMDYLGALRTKN